MNASERHVIAEWAPVMLQTDQLAEVLNKFAQLIDDLDSALVARLWKASVSDSGALPPADADVVEAATLRILAGSIEHAGAAQPGLNVKSAQWTSPYRKHLAGDVSV